MIAEAPIPGLCSVTFRHQSAEAILDLAAGNGVKAIEWGADVHLPPGALGRAQEISHRSEQLGIQESSYGSYFRAGVSDAEAEIAPLIETAAALGASHLRVWAGDTSGATASDKLWGDAARDLIAVADAADGHGISVSVEYHRGTLTETASDTIKLLTMADHSNLYSLWQPVPDRAPADWLTELALLEPWLSHLHVFHWQPDTPRDQRRPLREGEADWQTLFAHWEQSPRWDGAKIAFLEFVADDREENFVDDMKVLNSLCSART